MKNLEEQLVQYYYGEADNAAEIERVLAEDASARQLFAELSSLLDEIKPGDPPERGEDYGRRVWSRIQWKLEPPLRYRWWDFLTMRQLVPAALLAALIIGAFLIGRDSGPRAPVKRGISAQARQKILMLAVSDHLDRSQFVLVELLNAPPEGSPEDFDERADVGDLLTANRLYRTTAAESGNPMIAKVLDDLERVLIELRNSPGKLSPDELARFRHSIDEQGTLFKIRVLNTQLREQQQTDVRSAEAETF